MKGFRITRIAWRKAINFLHGKRFLTKLVERMKDVSYTHLQLCMKRTRTLLDQYPDVDGIMALDLCAAAFLKTEKNKKILAMKDI